MILIDHLIHYPDKPFGYCEWSHMWSDTHNIEELNQFAETIGLKLDWFQDRLNFPHYDVTKTKHALAIRKGAKLTDLGEWCKQNVNQRPNR